LSVGYVVHAPTQQAAAPLTPCFQQGKSAARMALRLATGPI
jgi:hypothetical protein